MPVLYTEWCVVRTLETAMYKEFTVLCRLGEDEARAREFAAELNANAAYPTGLGTVTYEARLMTPPVSGDPYVKHTSNE